MTDPSHDRDNPTPKDDRPAYELEPAAAPAATPAPAPAPAKEPTPKAGILEGFSPDNDFDHDPHVPGSAGSNKVKDRERADANEPPQAFVKPGMGGARVWAIVGGVLLASAIVAAAMNAANPFASSLLVVYNGLVHVGTGLAAVYVTSRLAGRPFGAVDLAAGRILTAVAAFLLVFHLNITLAGHGKWEEVVLGAIAYLAILAGLFRLWGRELGILAASHFFLWFLIEMGMQLSLWAGAATATQPATP